MSRLVIGGILGILVGIGFIVAAFVANLDGKVLVDRGVEVAVTKSYARYRAGTYVHFPTGDAGGCVCRVAEAPPIERIVYDPANTSRCRVPEAVGAWSLREIYWLIGGGLLILASLIPFVIQALMRAAEDPLERML